MISQQDMNNYKTQMQSRLALTTFVDNLIHDRKDPRVNESNLPQIREILLKQVNEAVNTHLVALLTDKDQAELSILLDKNVSDDELNTFFKSKISSFEAEMAAALLNFRAAYLYSTTNKQQEAVSAKQVPPVEQKQEQKTEDIDQLPPAPVM